MVFRATQEQKEEKERTRSALLRAALKLGAVHGFSSLGLREVAREAGIAPTSFYRHFADMEELGTSLIRELVGSSVRAACARIAPARGAAIAAALAQSGFELVERDPELVRFIVAERAGASAGFRKALRGELALLANALHAASTGQPLQPARPPPAAAEAVAALMLDACAGALDEPPAGRRAALESLGLAVQKLLLNGSAGARSK